MDILDYKILQTLMHQGRTTWSELAGILGLSSPAAADRVRKLEEQGVIRGYTALIDAESAGCSLTAMIAVTLTYSEHRESFLAKIQAMAEVQECHHIAGDEDYLLKVRCRGTRDLERIISEGLKSEPARPKTKTTIILSTVKETSHLPLAWEER